MDLEQRVKALEGARMFVGIDWSRDAMAQAHADRDHWKAESAKWLDNAHDLARKLEAAEARVRELEAAQGVKITGYSDSVVRDLEAKLAVSEATVARLTAPVIDEECEDAYRDVLPWPMSRAHALHLAAESLIARRLASPVEPPADAAAHDFPGPFTGAQECSRCGLSWYPGIKTVGECRPPVEPPPAQEPPPVEPPKAEPPVVTVASYNGGPPRSCCGKPVQDQRCILDPGHAGPCGWGARTSVEDAPPPMVSDTTCSKCGWLTDGNDHAPGSCLVPKATKFDPHIVAIELANDGAGPGK